METIINALMEIFSAHNFGACINVACFLTYLYFFIQQYKKIAYLHNILFLNI